MLKANICGPKIREARKKRGMAQVDLSAALEEEHGLDINQSKVSKIELRKRTVSDSELKALAEVLGVTADFLLDTDPEDPKD